MIIRKNKKRETKSAILSLSTQSNKDNNSAYYAIRCLRDVIDIINSNNNEKYFDKIIKTDILHYVSGYSYTKTEYYIYVIIERHYYVDKYTERSLNTELARTNFSIDFEKKKVY